MTIQLYSLADNRITWEKDGTLSVSDGKFDYSSMQSGRGLERLGRFLDAKEAVEDKEAFILTLSSVLYVPFVRFGDEIAAEETEKPEKKGKSDEDKPIQGENTSETDE